MSNGVGYTDMVIESRKMSKSVDYIRLILKLAKNDGMSCNFSVIKSYLYYKGGYYAHL